MTEPKSLPDIVINTTVQKRYSWWVRDNDKPGLSLDGYERLRDIHGFRLATEDDLRAAGYVTRAESGDGLIVAGLKGDVSHWHSKFKESEQRAKGAEADRDAALLRIQELEAKLLVHDRKPCIWHPQYCKALRECGELRAKLEQAERDLASANEYCARHSSHASALKDTVFRMAKEIDELRASTIPVAPPGALSELEPNSAIFRPKS